MRMHRFTRLAVVTAGLFSSHTGRLASAAGLGNAATSASFSSASAGGPLSRVLSDESKQFVKAYCRRKKQSIEAKLQELSPGSLPAGVEQQVDNFYLPMYAYFRDMLRQQQTPATTTTATTGPLMVGISAPQGCGKTTLTTLLELMFSLDNLTCVSCSIDDFYLTGAEQDRLAASHPGNPLVQYRGNAGSHDLELMYATLQQLKEAQSNQPDEPVLIPKYDKSLRAGRGDRADKTQWRAVSKKTADIVLFEGWMLGFEALNQEEKDETSMTVSGPSSDTTRILGPHLHQVNSFLKRYDRLSEIFDAWLIMSVDTTDHVYKWRLQAEKNMGLQGKPRLSDEQVKDFIDRFIPAYHAYAPTLYSRGPKRRSLTVPVLKVHVVEDRTVAGAELL